MREGRTRCAGRGSAAPPPRWARRQGGAGLARGPIGQKAMAHNPYYGNGLAKPLLLLAFLFGVVAWWRGASPAWWHGDTLQGLAWWQAGIGPRLCSFNARGAGRGADMRATLCKPLVAPVSATRPSPANSSCFQALPNRHKAFSYPRPTLSSLALVFLDILPSPATL